MGLEHYLFGFYVFVLICVILIITKCMFANVRRQRKMLDEQESKLLRAYQTLDDSTDEFYDLVAQSKNEVRQEVERFSGRAQPLDDLGGAGAPAPAVVQDPIRLYKAQQVQQSDVPPPAFEQLYNEAAVTAETPAATQHEQVLQLSKQGMNRAEIAKTLQITQSEVGLIVGMYK